MKKITTSKIIALCMGDFARGIIGGIVTTYLLTFFIPTNSDTTLPRFFLNAALITTARHCSTTMPWWMRSPIPG